jgi:hypothetical protein
MGFLPRTRDDSRIQKEFPHHHPTPTEGDPMEVLIIALIIAVVIRLLARSFRNRTETEMKKEPYRRAAKRIIVGDPTIRHRTTTELVEEERRKMDL